ARRGRAWGDLSEATRFLQARLSAGETDAALAGATPYLRMMSLAAGGAYLARGALADRGQDRVSLCRFYAENLLCDVAALRERVLGGAASLGEAAGALLVS